MKTHFFNKTTVICLASVSVAAFLIRIIYPHNAVFGMGFVNFLETDAWNRMWYAKQIAVMLDQSAWQAIFYTTQHSLLFSFTVAVLSKAAPLELVGAWLPPILAVGTVLLIYGIGATLFDRRIGILAALFVAIIPSEFLHRTLLGFADHHAMECFLMTAVILLLAKALTHEKVLNRYSVLTGLVLFLYMANWASGLYLMGAMLAILLIAMAAYNLVTRRRWLPNAVAVVVPMAIGLALYLPLGGYQHLMWLLPSSATVDSVPVQTTQEIVTTVFSPIQSRTISEIMPLLMPFGKFDIRVVVFNLHLFAIAFLLGMVFLWRHRGDKGMWLMIVWTAVMLVITLNQRRFLYYLTFNIALLSSLALFELARRFKGNTTQTAIFLAIPLLLISMPLAANIGQYRAFHTTKEWHDALVWLREQPGEQYVTAWTDYGHWIQYISDKIPNYTPGPGGELVARLFLSTDDNEAKSIMDDLHTDYLIVDEATLTSKYFALVVYADHDIPDKSKAFAFRLYYENKAPPFLELMYRSTTLAIFKYHPS